MKHNILTETAFFRAIQNGNIDEITAGYDDFIATVISVCRDNDQTSAYIALSYAEIEIKACATDDKAGKGYADKALAFITEMRNMLETNIVKPSAPDSPVLEWTGQTIDLVELLYALKETGSINNGEMPICKMSDVFFPLFGRKVLRDYTRFYVSIKSRETDYSYTYFIDKMRRKLNERIKADIKKSLQR